MQRTAAPKGYPASSGTRRIAKKRIKKDLGITALLKPDRWWPNQKRKFKRKIGYESNTGRLLRDGLPKPGGCLVVFVFIFTMIGGATLVAWLT